MDIKFVKLSNNAVIPCYGKVGDAGLDLYTAEDVVIKAGETVAIPTDIAIQLSQGYEATVRPRSGISLKGVSCTVNGLGLQRKAYLRVQLGTVDSNYRGNIGIITYNQEDYDVFLPKGTKLAQLVIAPVMRVDLIECDKLEESERNSDGFGSSGER